MNEEFEKFCNEVKDHIFENSADRDNLEIELRHVQKVNQQDLVNLTVKPKDSNIAPSIQLNAAFEAFKDGKSMDDIISSLENTISSHAVTENLDVSYISEFDSCKSQVFPKLINKDMNEELLQNVPHYDYGDLAVLFYVKVENPQIGEGSVTVNNQIFEQWGVEDKAIMDAAMDNLKANTQCKDLFGFIQELHPGLSDEIGADVPPDKSPIIVSTDSQTFGAAAILNEDIMKALCERVGGDIVILPSSIHECLVLGDDNTPDQEIALNDMVKSVNDTTVAQEDLLSDHIYHFNGEELMMRELPKYADIEDVRNTVFTNMDLVSAQTGEIYRQGKEQAPKEQDKSKEIVNIDDKKTVPKRDDLAI